MPDGPPIPEVLLEVIQPDGGRQLVKVTRSPFRIGRGQDAGNDLPLPDKRISRQCASLLYADGGFRLEDCGQRHGVFVNGEKIEARPLQDGDTISFGLADSYTLVFHRGPTAPSVDSLLQRLAGAGELEPETSSLRKLSLLLEAAALLQSQLPLEDILAKVVDHAIEITGADRGVLLQAEAKGEPRAVLARQPGGQPPAPAASRPPPAFSQLNRKVLAAPAPEAADVLDNARLVLKEMERKRMEQELTIAREIQQALSLKDFKQQPHLQVTGVNRSCLAVGGDYFDLMELDEGRTAFVIADVCGKGLGAALVTAMLQGTFSAMTLGQEPAGVFAHVNRFICTHSEVQRYATLFFGILGRDGALTYLNAGHLPPLLIRGGTVEPVMSSECMPIGLWPEAEFSARTSRLEPGATLVLYTDGVSEAPNLRDDQFEIERLQEVVARNTKASVEDLQAAILAALDDFTRGAYQADDITLLILRYLGPRP